MHGATMKIFQSVKKLDYMLKAVATKILKITDKVAYS